jgi:hypothetical protein
MSLPLYRLVDISPDLAVCPCPGMVVRRVDDEKCLLFTPGQSALEGFLVDAPWDQVISDLNDELERAVEEAEGEPDDDEAD